MSCLGLRALAAYPWRKAGRVMVLVMVVLVVAVVAAVVAAAAAVVVSRGRLSVYVARGAPLLARRIALDTCTSCGTSVGRELRAKIVRRFCCSRNGDMVCASSPNPLPSLCKPNVLGSGRVFLCGGEVIVVAKKLFKRSGWSDSRSPGNYR